MSAHLTKGKLQSPDRQPDEIRRCPQFSIYRMKSTCFKSNIKYKKGSTKEVRAKQDATLMAVIISQRQITNRPVTQNGGESTSGLLNRLEVLIVVLD